MGFFGLIKNKKQAPSELPDLISDEIEKESSQELNTFLKEESKVAPHTGEVEPIINGAPIEKKKLSEEEVRNNTSVLNRLIKNVEETPNREMASERVSGTLPRKSFFNDIHENISKELSDLDSLEKFKKDFSSRSVLDDMKEYWKNQKKENVLELLGRDYQQKISEKISSLQELEKSWQVVYFELIEKEEEIKDAEKELKELLNEFVKVCDHKKKSLNEKAFGDRRSGVKDEKASKSPKKKK